MPTGSVITGRLEIQNVSAALIDWRLGDSVAEGDLCDTEGQVVAASDTRGMYFDMPVPATVRSRGAGSQASRQG